LEIFVFCAEAALDKKEGKERSILGLSSPLSPQNPVRLRQYPA